MGKADPQRGGSPALLQQRFEAQEDEHRLLNYRRGALLAALFIALGAGMDWVAFGTSSAQSLVAGSYRTDSYGCPSQKTLGTWSETGYVSSCCIVGWANSA